MRNRQFFLKSILSSFVFLSLLGIPDLSAQIAASAHVAPEAAKGADAGLVDAQNFIDKLGEKAIALLTDAKIDGKTRQKRFRDLFDRHFAVKDIGMFALGRYKRLAKGNQLDEYLSLYEDDITETYASRFGHYKGEKFKVLSAMPPAKDGAILVKTQILQPSGQIVSVKWKVYRKGDDFKIYDIFIEDVSMSLAQRDEFSQVLQDAGAPAQGLEPLLKRLREKTVLRGELPGLDKAKPAPQSATA